MPVKVGERSGSLNHRFEERRLGHGCWRVSAKRLGMETDAKHRVSVRIQLERCRGNVRDCRHDVAQSHLLQRLKAAGK